MGKWRHIGLVCLGILAVSFTGRFANGRGWDRIRLRTLDGKVYGLPNLHKKLAAIVFLSPECPLCQNYSLVLNKLQARFGKDLDIAGVFPGKANTPAACLAFQDKYHIQFLLLTDERMELVKTLGGRITPEVFLLDKDRNVLYQGAIDNWVAALGKQRNKATENYLEDGIASYLSGETVRVKEVKAIGCFINDR
ncbi:MAG: redoxin family protein [Puia sp.]|nr:redoxin family protein [Puia sp.]